MGDEIKRRYFDGEHFSAFRRALDEEQALLARYFEAQRFSPRGDVAGFELEAWLVDDTGDPLPGNSTFLEALNNPLVVPELATYNVELNGSPTALTGRPFSRLFDELSATWGACQQVARGLGSGLVTIGILPTIKEAMLDSAHMSSLQRYHSLNDRVMALRDGRPLNIDIDGEVPLRATHQDVMLEAAATSFQIHLQCRPERAVRDFNASLVASAPMVAVSANAPFLFGHALWDETRVPLFEQSVDVGERYPPRVTFGDGYVQQSLLELFESNHRDHPILLPAELDGPPDRFQHVRFHNGTLWRWNRPLIGFDFDGQPHLRIEHRVVPAGPTIRDCIANAAFYYGLVYGLGLWRTAPDALLPFDKARDNFYSAARYGLNARLLWVDDNGDREIGVRQLVLEELLPLARVGLQSRNLPDAEIDEQLNIVGARVEAAQNGAAWQRRWVAMHGTDLNELVRVYRDLQDQGEPVHTWSL